MRIRFLVALFTVLAMSAGCGGTSPSANPGVPTPAPSSAPGTPAPTVAPTSAGPTDGGSTSIPSPLPDPILEAAFPDQIDGQPVTDLSSGGLLAFMQEWSTEEELDKFVTAMQSIGVNPASISLGGANATVGGEEVFIQALRVAGGSAVAVVAKILELNQDDPRTMTAGTLGGKQVTLATDSDGDIDYYYFNGEFVWILSMDEASATVVLAALP